MKRTEEAARENKSALSQLISHTKNVERAVTMSQQDILTKKETQVQKWVNFINFHIYITFLLYFSRPTSFLSLYHSVHGFMRVLLMLSSNAKIMIENVFTNGFFSIDLGKYFEYLHVWWYNLWYIFIFNKTAYHINIHNSK